MNNNIFSICVALFFTTILMGCEEKEQNLHTIEDVVYFFCESGIQCDGTYSSQEECEIEADYTWVSAYENNIKDYGPDCGQAFVDYYVCFFEQHSNECSEEMNYCEDLLEDYQTVCGF